MMDYATYHRLHVRCTKLRQARRELKIQLDRAGQPRPVDLAFRHAAVDRALGKVERRMNALRLQDAQQAVAAASAS
jgi:hypothetical protein